MSCLWRVFLEVAVTHGFISRDTVPDIPSIRSPKDQEHRRDDLTAKEWEELERAKCEEDADKYLEHVFDYCKKDYQKAFQKKE